MTRIKSNNVQVGGSFVVPIEQSHNSAKLKEAMAKEQELVLQGEAKAQQIIAEAQQQAQEIIDNANAQGQANIEAIQEEARLEGFESGRQEGLVSITEELQEKIDAVNDFAECCCDIKKSLVKSAHAEIIKLIVEISEKICTKSLELNENILAEITQNAIQSLKDKEHVTIIVHPLMAERIYSLSDELKERIPQLSSIKIIEDASVSPDGTIVESQLSRVDCRIKSQINEITDRLMAKLDSTPMEELLDEINDER